MSCDCGSLPIKVKIFLECGYFRSFGNTVLFPMHLASMVCESQVVVCC